MESKVEALPILFIGDLLKIEGNVPQERPLIASCIQGDLCVIDLKYENDNYNIELNLCTQIDENQLKAENLHVVTEIVFEIATEEDLSERGNLSADVVSDESFTVHLPVEILLGKFKIIKYRLIPIGLLRVLYANILKKNVPARQNSCNSHPLTGLDVYENLNACMEKAREIELSTVSKKVMTSDKMKKLTLLQESLNQDKNNLFVNGLSNIQFITSTNWIGKLSSLLRDIKTAKKNVKTHKIFLEKLTIKHEEKLEFISVLEENGIQYVCQVEELNDYITRKEHCFVLFFHSKSYKNHPEDYEKLLAFFQKFTKFNTSTNLGLEQDHAFLAVDRHVILNKELAIIPPNENAIYYIRKSVIKSRDFIKDWKKEKSSNIARVKINKDGHELNIRGRLMIRCPKIDCPNVPREWLCEDCGEYFDFGFNGCVYCNCDIFTRKGKFLKNFQFRCKHRGHGFYFADYNAECAENLKNIVPVENISILVLGQRNVGKTTFIKTIISVLAYRDRVDAQQKIAGLKGLEILKTKTCNIYSVRFRNYNVRLIDTPGLFDNANIHSVKKILDCIRTIDSLHGICVLVKSHEFENEMPTIQSCLKQILSLIHRNLMSNVVFCSTYYPSHVSELQNTLPVLEDISTEIGLSNSHLFQSFDLKFYDSFETQSTDFNGVDLTPGEEVNFKNNWEKTAQETSRLLDFLVTLKPQRVKETLDMNESRWKISKLLLTMFEMMEDIEKNVSNIRETQKMVKSLSALRKDHLENVCTDECCVQYLKSSIPKERVCHCSNNCYGDRNNYDCGWKTHVYICCGDEDSEIQIKTKNSEVIVRNKKNMEAKAPKNLENHVNLLQKEKEKIEEIGEKFATYFKNQASLVDNFWCCSYLYCFLGSSLVEKRETVVNYLQKIQPCKKEILDWFNNDDHGEFEGFGSLEQELCSLPIYGRKFKTKALHNSEENDLPVSSSSNNILPQRLLRQFLPLDFSMYNIGSKRESSCDERPGPSKIRKLS